MTDLSSDILGNGDEQGEPKQPDLSSDILQDSPPAGRLGVAMQAAHEQPAAEAAKVYDLQSKTGLPSDVIQRNPELVDKNYKASQFDPHGFIESSPKTAGWLSDPTRAAMAKDSLPQMQAIEHSVEDHSWLKNVGASVMIGGAQLAKQVGQIPQLTEAARQGIEEPQDTRSAGISDQQIVQDGVPDAREALKAAKAQWLQESGHNALTDVAEQATRYWENPDLQQENAQRVAELWKTDRTAAMRKLSYGIAEGLPSMLLLIGSAGSSALAGGAVMGTQALGSSAESTNQALEAGQTPGKAALTGSVKGGIFAAGSVFGSLNPLKVYEGALEKTLGSTVGRAAFRSMLTDTIKSYASSLTSGLVAGAGMTGANKLTDFVSGTDPHALDNIGQEMMEGGLVMGGTNALIGGAMTAGGLHERSNEIHQADLNKQFLVKLAADYENSPLSKVSREAAADHLSTVMAGSHAEKAYSPAVDFKTYFQEKGLDPLKAATDLGVGKEYLEAEKSGADFVIPTAKVVDSVGRGDIGKDFFDHLKFDPSESTPEQAKALVSQVQEQDAAAQNAPLDDAARVGELVKKQMLDAGMSERQAETDAKLYEERYRTRAMRRGQEGVGPRELLDQWPIRIERQGQPDLKIDASKEDPRALLQARNAALTPEQQQGEAFIDQHTGALKPTALAALKPSADLPLYAYTKVPHLKFVNEELNRPAGDAGKAYKGDYESGDKLIRLATQAQLPYATDLTTAGGGHFMRVRDQAHFDQIMASANSAMPDAVKFGDKVVNGKAFKLGGAVGSTPEEAKAKYRAQRNLANRGKAPENLEAPKGAEPVEPGTDKVAVPAELKALHEGMSPEEAVKASNFSAKNPNVLSREGFDRLPMKDFQAHVDLKGIGKMSQEAGDLAIAAFEREILMRSREDGMQVDLARKNDNSDEYFLQHDDSKKLEKLLVDSARRLREANIGYEINGKVYALNGVEFAAGIGGSHEHAAEQLEQAKGQLRGNSSAGNESQRVPGGESRSGQAGQGNQDRNGRGNGVSARHDNAGAGRSAREVTGGLTEGDRLDLKQQLKMQQIIDQGGVSPVTDFIAANGKLSHKFITDAGNARAYPEKTQGNRLFSETGENPGRMMERLVEAGLLPKTATEGDLQDVLTKEAKAKGDVVSEFGMGSKARGLQVYDRMMAKRKAGDVPKFSSLEQTSLGSFTPTPEESLIRLMKKSNTSTMLHESWHRFYHEMAQDNAYVRSLAPDKLTDAQRVLQGDMDIVLKNVGASSFETMTRAQHEKLAKWGEEYLREGKAPSAELKPVFERFRTWLIGVYRNVQKLLQGQKGVSDEMRGVMDRMLASDDAIAAAQAKQGNEPLPGLTEPRYLDAIAAAHAASVDTLQEKLIAQWQRQRKAEWKTQRDEHFKAALEEVTQRPEYKTLGILKEGKFGKLDGDALKAEFGKDALKGLPKDVVAGDGEDSNAPDQAAAFLGYTSAADMLAAIKGKPTAEALAGQMADARMELEHGDLMTDGTMPAEALAAAHNDARAKLLRMELQHIAQQDMPALKGMIRKVAQSVPSEHAVKAAASFIIGDKPVGDIKSNIYLRGENQMRNLAAQLFTKGDFKAAFEAKQKELLNHELYRAASDASDNTAKMAKYLKRFDKESTSTRIGKAGENYIGAIDYIRGQHGLGDPAGADGKAKLDSLLSSLERAGSPMLLPDSVVNAQARSFRSVPYTDLGNAYKAVKMIDHAAMEKNVLLKAFKDATFEENQRNLRASVKAIHGEGFGGDKGAQHDYNPGVAAELNKARRQGLAPLLRTLEIIGEIDGHKANGVAFNMLWQPKQQAEIAEAARMRNFREVEKNVLWKAYNREERSLLFTRRIEVPEIKQSLTKERMLMIAANWGNEENRTALREGNGYTDEQVKAILGHLDARDWNTVEAMWKHLDSYWPDIAAQESRARGVVPEKVESSGFDVTLPDGSVRHLDGGYFPILFDRERSPRVPDMEDIKNVGEMLGGDFAKWMTKDGHTHERVGTNGAALKLDLNRFTTHVRSVIHDLSYRETLIDLHKLVNDQSIKGDIVKAVGKEKWDELNPWIGRMAGRQDAGEWWNHLAGWLRTNLTSAKLAYRLSVGLKHSGSEFTTLHELGPVYTAKGLSSVTNLLKVKANIQRMHDLSPYMKNRDDAGDRDMHDFVRGRGLLNEPGLLAKLAESVVGGKVGAKVGMADAWKKEAEMTYFSFVRMVDKMASSATWHGTLSKAMDGKIDGIKMGDVKAAIAHADRMVQEVKGAGGPGDLPRILAGDNWQKLFTMFMTQRNVIFNQHAKSVQQGGYNWAKGGLSMAAGPIISALLLKWAVPAIWNHVWTKGVPDTDEKAKEMAFDVANYPAEGIPLASELLRVAEAKAQGKSAHMSLPPLQFGEDLVKAGMGLYHLGWGDEVKREEAKAAASAAGVLFKLPGEQMFQFLDYINGLLDGSQDPSNPAEAAWRATVAGRKR